MRKLIFATALLTMFSGASVAEVRQLTAEEICKANVDGTITAMEFERQQTGKEKPLSGLTIAQIKQIVQEQGECAASQAINDKKGK